MFVLLLVRKIIDFCEGEMEGPRIVLPTGTLTHRFFGVRKVDPPKLALATGIGRFRDPFFGRKKVAFFEKNAKSGHETFTFGKGCQNHLTKMVCTLKTEIYFACGGSGKMKMSFMHLYKRPVDKRNNK